MATSNLGTVGSNAAHYRPDIDGLRALAVVPVLLFHAKLGCPGGFVGVDVFFVISGYLISSLIFGEQEAGTFSLVNFWERRIRRILPALAAVILAIVVAGWFLFLPEDLESLGKSIIAQATLTSNIFFYHQGLLEGGYFATTAETKTLLHTWSLAVEEQFYLFFPVLVMLVVRLGKNWLVRIIAGLAIGSLVWSVVGSYTSPSATFYLLQTRAWELLLGVLLSLLRGRLSAGKVAGEACGWIGLGLILEAVFCYDGQTRFPGLGAVPPCLGAALIIFSSEAGLSSVGRLLALGPVAFVGLISYSLYLWHWPLLVFAKYYCRYRDMAGGEAGAGLRAGILLASAGLAVLSWKFVETPVRKRWVFQKRSQVFGFAAASFATLLALGLFLFHDDGVPARFHGRALSYVKTRNHRAVLDETSLERAKAGRFFEIGTHDTNQPIRLLLWGDSHAMSVASVLDEMCRRHSWRCAEATCSATPPILGYSDTNRFGLGPKTPEFTAAVLDFISREHIPNVLLAARWSAYLGSDAVKTQLLTTVRAVTNCGARVYILEDVPYQDHDLTRLVGVAVLHDDDLGQLGATRESYEQMNAGFQDAFDQAGKLGAVELDPSGYFLNDRGLYGMVKDDRVLYWDYHHLTVEGAELLAPLFEPIFRAQNTGGNGSTAGVQAK
jgi:peptidoglycan/LPS O-acetylase OafA/YrhL